MKVQFTPNGWADYLGWIKEDAKRVHKLNTLIEDVRRSPFKGLGKPEPLKGHRAGWWSRRITDEDRLVYRITGTAEAQQVEVAQRRGHY